VKVWLNLSHEIFKDHPQVFWKSALVCRNLPLCVNITWRYERVMHVSGHIVKAALSGIQRVGVDGPRAHDGASFLTLHSAISAAQAETFGGLAVPCR
jgi:hypothetical protein